MKSRWPKRWFNTISKNLNRLSEAIAWYTVEFETSYPDVDISGSLMRANQNQPGLIAYYDAMHGDLDMILEIVERNLKTIRAQTLRNWADHPPTNTKMNSTELKTMLDCEKEVIDASVLVEDVKFLHKAYGSMMKSLEQRGYSLNNITKLRVAGMEEVEV